MREFEPLLIPITETMKGNKMDPELLHVPELLLGGNSAYSSRILISKSKCLSTL